MTCLTLDHTQVDKLRLAECDVYSSFQKWFFTHMNLTGGNQYWMFRTDGKILRDYLCIGSQQNEAKEHDVVLVPCEDHTFWHYDNEKNLVGLQRDDDMLNS
eukprot:TRINITY_DN11144_c0_g1_i1.p1 TRINITY_DN11144_c0_g1~~TRINITY_DN11144_c0_g1_i1.p1  ORF type:complete len:101 (+),score=7.92 TRINITY_DN11144_c0_g1_i1:1-303(+)